MNASWPNPCVANGEISLASHHHTRLHAFQMGTTNLHLDMADAINVLVHVEDAGSGLEGVEDAVYEGEPIEPTHGAVWHIFSQADTKTLQRLLPRIVHDVGLQEKSTQLLESCCPLLDSGIYLDEPLLRTVQQLAGITPYMVLQRLGDAVIVPAGCAHQVLSHPHSKRTTFARNPGRVLFGHRVFPRPLPFF